MGMDLDSQLDSLNSTMTRGLIWLEDSTFAAWSCNVCNWMFANPGIADSGKPPTEVLDAFNRHDCAQFPRSRRP
jgi:hypothetical protein